MQIYFCFVDMKKLILSIIVTSSLLTSSAMVNTLPEVPTSNQKKISALKVPCIYSETRLGKIELFHDEDGFHVLSDDQLHDIQNCFVDKQLRNISSSDLRKFLGMDKPDIFLIEAGDLDEEMADFGFTVASELTQDQ